MCSSPPAEYNETLSVYVTSCNATIPDFGIVIGGRTFKLAPQDTLLQYTEGITGGCATAITKGFSVSGKAFPHGFNVLGDVFLNSVVATFDVYNEELRLSDQVRVSANSSTPSNPGSSEVPAQSNGASSGAGIPILAVACGLILGLFPL